jgi:hypothetical protein
VKLIGALTKEIHEIGALTRDNRRILDLQFRRIAQIQAELDQLTASNRRMKAS